MCTILQQTNKQTYHKKDFCLSYCNFLQQTAALYIYLSIGDSVKWYSYGSRNYKL